MCYICVIEPTALVPDGKYLEQSKSVLVNLERTASEFIHFIFVGLAGHQFLF